MTINWVTYKFHQIVSCVLQFPIKVFSESVSEAGKKPNYVWAVNAHLSQL